MSHLIADIFLVKSTDSLGNHLNHLLREAENRIHELSGIEDSPQAQFSTRASFSSIIGEFIFLFFFIMLLLHFLFHATSISSILRLLFCFLIFMLYIQPYLTSKLTGCVILQQVEKEK